MEITKGWKTSEFIFTALVTILGLLMASGLLGDGGLAVTIVGGAMAVLKSMGYTYSRTQVKKNAGMADAVKVGLANPTPPSP